MERAAQRPNEQQHHGISDFHEIYAELERMDRVITQAENRLYPRHTLEKRDDPKLASIEEELRKLKEPGQNSEEEDPNQPNA